MDELRIALRFVHFAAVIALFGEFAFLLCVARPALRETVETMANERLALQRRLVRAASWCLALVFGSGVLWLAAQAASVSGMTFVRALNRETLGAVLAETLFGHVWIVRLALAAALSAALLFLGRAADRQDSRTLGACALLAGGLLGSLAWAGHAVGEQGTDRIIHLSADAVHLIAAGAWLGALPPLAFVLARARRAASKEALDFAARATRRFSRLGVASVGALVLTGVANAWYTLGSVPALFGTDYGRLLLAKLLLFGAMVTLAAINRLRLTPRLSSVSGECSAELALPALRRLERNAIAETALGLAVLGIVGTLGITIPALHVQTVWPFPYTLDWDAVEASGGIPAAAFVAALVAGALVVSSLRARKRKMTAAGVALLLGAVAVSAWLLTVPAYPTTYFRSPVRFSAASIARGAPLYAQHCATCHGALGYGDGPAAISLPVRPANLTGHLFHHREGNLLWWLQHGIAGTPMPGFGDRINEDRLWDVLNFLRAQAEAEEGKTMNASVEPWRAIVAPDSTFQIGGQPQGSLVQQRGHRVILLVFYTLPASLARLGALTESRSELERLGVRVIAVPMQEAEAIPRGAPAIYAAMLAEPDSRIVAAYAVYWRTASGAPSAPEHVEFLVDRQGYLRARWMPGLESGWNSIPELLHQAEVLNQEKPHTPAPDRHMH
jgi:putative copper export protein/mono/diheme cytochrome c family protein/peroxiredoxin